MQTDELLTAEQLAERLNLSPHTIKIWSREDRIPTIWLSATVRRFDLAIVLESLRQSSASRSPNRGAVANV
jgi:DNA-binding transcriptional MerR regulator